MTEPAFDRGTDKPPGCPLAELMIQEVRVTGFTKLCPDVPGELRGTSARIGSTAALEYLTKLGVNAVGYFAPECSYSSSGCKGEQVHEFKMMAKNLHAAGIEVILDVVYNHTAEGDHLGPTISFKGIDNRAYYRLVLCNAHHEAISFTLPGRETVRWETVIDTMDEAGFLAAAKQSAPGDESPLGAVVEPVASGDRRAGRGADFEWAQKRKSPRVGAEDDSRRRAGRRPVRGTGGVVAGSDFV